VPACSSCVREFTSAQGIQDAWNYLTTGTSYGGEYKLRNPTGYPNLNGIMAFPIEFDRWNNHQFSNAIGPMLHALPELK
jgi:chitinase